MSVDLHNRGPGASTLEHQVLGILESYLVRRRYRAGEILWNAGDAPGVLVTIVSGRVRAFRPLASGKEVDIYLFGPGDVFGFLPFLDGAPYPASTQAVTPVDARIVSREQLLVALETDPAVARALLSAFAKRLRDAFAKIEAISSQKALPRVAGALAAQMRVDDDPQGTNVIQLPVSSRLFAQGLGLTAESLSRAVTELVDHGILHRLGHRRLQVLDADALHVAAIEGLPVTPRSAPDRRPAGTRSCRAPRSSRRRPPS